MTTLVYATGNHGKFAEVSKFFSGHGLTLHLPAEFNVHLTVEELGTTLKENAYLKASAYSQPLGKSFLVIGDDTGVEIDALHGEPGIYVRRWRDHREDMTDEAIIQYCLERLRGVVNRSARMHTVLAAVTAGTKVQYFEGVLEGHLVEKPIPLRMAGFPFESLFYADEYRLMLGEIHQLTIKEKLTKGILTHRERAFQSFLSWYNPEV